MQNGISLSTTATFMQNGISLSTTATVSATADLCWTSSTFATSEAHTKLLGSIISMLTPHRFSIRISLLLHVP
jgi:hypothetical protein